MYAASCLKHGFGESAIKGEIVVGTKAKIIVFIILTLLVGVILVNTSVINLDHLGQGKLLSVVIDDQTCYTTICENGSRELIITEPKILSSLESVFFYKVRDVFHMTKESGNLTFTFNYEHKTIIFDAGIEVGFTKGLIYYIDRVSVYHFDQSGIKTLKSLFDIQ
jgi:hypothetical protein